MIWNWGAGLTIKFNRKDTEDAEKKCFIRIFERKILINVLRFKNIRFSEGGVHSIFHPLRKNDINKTLSAPSASLVSKANGR
jgi:hypothetical protein